MCEMGPESETFDLLEQVDAFLENIYGAPRRLSSILHNHGLCEEDVTRLVQEHLDAYLTKFLGHCTAWMAKMVSERRYHILVRYYGLDRNPRTTLTALAKRYGVSHQRVRQLRASAFRRLAHRAHKQQLEQMALAVAQMFLYPNDIAANSELEDLLSPTPRPLGTKRIRRDSPANAGQPWTKEEEQRLVAGYKAGDSIEDLSTKHQRTPVAIRSRLARLGRHECANRHGSASATSTSPRQANNPWRHKVMQFPDEPKKIRARITRYERVLRKEQERYGHVSDGYGKRYLLGPLYMLLGDENGAIESFKWFEQTFPDDIGDPIQYLCWTLALYRTGDIAGATRKLQETMLSNLYLIPHVLGEDQEELDIWHGTNIAEKGYLEYWPPEIWALWDDAALEWARETYDSDEFRRVRGRYIQILEQLGSEPVGPRRSRLVDEMYRLKTARPDEE